MSLALLCLFFVMCMCLPDFLLFWSSFRHDLKLFLIPKGISVCYYKFLIDCWCRRQKSFLTTFSPSHFTCLSIILYVGVALLNNLRINSNQLWWNGRFFRWPDVQWLADQLQIMNLGVKTYDRNSLIICALVLAQFTWLWMSDSVDGRNSAKRKAGGHSCSTDALRILKALILQFFYCYWDF